MSNSAYNMVTVLGATASGKTGLAAHLALRLNGEIISADSRQVYRGMDLGTGKDLEDYTVDGKPIPYHIIDIANAGYQYNIFEYQHDFIKAFEDVTKREKFPVLCGGSGLYLESVLNGYRLVQVPHNDELREELKEKSLDELTGILKNYQAKLHNTTDIVNVKRAIRAIEIEEYCQKHPDIDISFPDINSLIVGVKFDRNSRRRRITERLKQRLDEGMVDEVRRLLDSGVKPDELIYYGLEYKYLTLHATGQLTFNEMFKQLETAIHQFAKRQMTWYRRMERNGTKIRWIDGYVPMEEKVEKVMGWLKEGK